MLLYRELQRSRLSDGKSKAISMIRMIPALTLSPRGSPLYNGATIVRAGRLMTLSKRWQPAALAMCGQQDTKVLQTVAAICLSPTTTMGLDGRNISPVTVVGVIPTISTELRQAHPAMHGLLEVMTLLVVTMLHWPSTGQVPRGLKLPAIALLQAGITTTCLA